MIILEHSTYDDRTIRDNVGRPEYSYWFVRKFFRPILEEIGIVIPVGDPAREVARIYDAARAEGQPCIFISFNPPNLTPLDTGCPTVPTFAWEFDTIPNEAWDDDPRNDWSYALSHVDAAITHCSFSRKAVQRSLGDNYPVWSIPAPIADRRNGKTLSAHGWRTGVQLNFGNALVFDSEQIDPFLFDRRNDLLLSRAMNRLERIAPVGPRSRSVTLTGAVYTTILNPMDGRKNWKDMISGFVTAFREEPAATLILKTTHRQLYEGVTPILAHMANLGGYRCRILVVHGMLDDADYNALVEATSYAVNTSEGEGQCLPLMEFMSAGRPAVAPRHTAMIDYVNKANTFIIADHQRPSAWPADPRRAIRCLRHQIDLADLIENYRKSFLVARDAPATYGEMSRAASAALRSFCSDDVVRTGMAQVVHHLGLASSKTSRQANP